MTPYSLWYQMKSPKSSTRNDERLQRTIIQNHSFIFPVISMNNNECFCPLLRNPKLKKSPFAKVFMFQRQQIFRRIKLWTASLDELHDQFQEPVHCCGKMIPHGMWYTKWNCQKVIPEINAIIPLRISLQMSVCSIVWYAYIQKEPFWWWHVM